MQQVVEKYPQSDVAELAGMIIKGVQQGRQLHGGKFDMGDVWSRRASDMASDSTKTDTLRFERETKYVFLLAYLPDSVNQNQLLFEMARYNFSNYLVRNFDIEMDQDANGLCRMLISGFLNYDEARQYARQLYAADGQLATMLHACRSLIVSEQNLRLLGTTYSARNRLNLSRYPNVHCWKNQRLSYKRLTKLEKTMKAKKTKSQHHRTRSQLTTPSSTTIP